MSWRCEPRKRCHNQATAAFPNSTSTEEPLSIDISSDKSIAAAFKQVKDKFGYIDIFINNAELGDDRAARDVRDKSAMGAIDPAICVGFCFDVVEGKRDEQAWPVKVLRKDTVQPW
ncbi:uncharacterized protein BCR38DRAFT_477638 [Pseudomassariella vexata]|uniref:Uncharacterized protein n=1 Tax=Pseudomassariella vexata TaxID=1141098 RepID=A0A1Y2DHT0_9PEZI|nr:uncharacterized protein BCR38DRAFT_477638 [Pseudomassariella vexata]ORY58802.1 hypothetical protein BCR38DRAFT_477638 [Pseudomassariella vexata]